MPRRIINIVPPYEAVVNELWRVVYAEKEKGTSGALYDFCVAFGAVIQRMDMPHEAIRWVADELMKIRCILQHARYERSACVILTSAIETLHVRLHANTAVSKTS